MNQIKEIIIKQKMISNGTKQMILDKFPTKEKIIDKDISILKSFKLSWSEHWKSNALNLLNINNMENLEEFLLNSDPWSDFLLNLEKILQEKWLEKAFRSIRTGSKGLYESRYIDHALISVPPPYKLFKKIIDTLTEHDILCIEAPTGWGKSRLILWISLAFSFTLNQIYYIPEPNDLDIIKLEGMFEKIFKKNMIIIIDDFHLFLDSIDMRRAWRKFFKLAKEEKTKIIVIITSGSETYNKLSWPSEMEFITSTQYLEFWRPDWIDNFKLWFNGLSKTALKKYINETLLDEALKAPNPWVFISVLVNLQEIIKNQFSPKIDFDSILLLTLIIWGYAVSGETGVSVNQLYNGLLWVKTNRNDLWKLLEKEGGPLWDDLNKDDKKEFIEEIIRKIEEWRKKPENPSHIRILPSKGGRIGKNTTIPAPHIAWWEYSLKKIWETDWNQYLTIFDICELTFIHGCEYVFGKWINIPNTCEIFRNCNNIQHLNLDSIEGIMDFSALESCSNLKSLSLSSCGLNKFPHILTKIVGLKTLNISKNQISVISNEISNIRLLETLILNDNPLEELPNSLMKLEYLKFLNLGIDKIWNSVKNYPFLQKLKKKGIDVIGLSSYKWKIVILGAEKEFLKSFLDFYLKQKKYDMTYFTVGLSIYVCDFIFNTSNYYFQVKVIIEYIKNTRINMYNSIRKTFGHGALIVIDLTSLESFKTLEEKIEILIGKLIFDNSVYIIGITNEENETRIGDLNVIEDLTKRYNVHYMELEDIKRQNIEDIFIPLLKVMAKKYEDKYY
ncbi:MAG: hypothetical protein ACFFAO_19910 [Candidatus Hermodarchaeota archaeon]